MPANEESIFSKKSSPKRSSTSTAPDDEVPAEALHTHAQGSGDDPPDETHEAVLVGGVALHEATGGVVPLLVTTAGAGKSGAIGFQASISAIALLLAFFVPLYSFFHLKRTPLIRLIS